MAQLISNLCISTSVFASASSSWPVHAPAFSFVSLPVCASTSVRESASTFVFATVSAFVSAFAFLTLSHVRVYVGINHVASAFASMIALLVAPCSVHQNKSRPFAKSTRRQSEQN